MTIATANQISWLMQNFLLVCIPDDLASNNGTYGCGA
jgi:hypothetical protein